MRAYLPSYELVTPPSLDEALKLLAAKPGEWKLFAGGTDLMVLFEAGKLEHRKFLSLHNIYVLKGIHEEADALVIGSGATYTDIQGHSVLKAEYPNLVRAAAETGAIAIQNRGTLGGNIANASPAADSSPALLSYDAEIEIISLTGMRRIPYAKFHQGYKKIDLKPDEIIRSIRIPRAKQKYDECHYYRKVGTRRAQAISKVCMAARADLMDGKAINVRIALGSVGPIPLRCPKTEAALEGKPVKDPSVLKAARAALAQEITPIDDIRSDAVYRREVALNLLSELYDVELGS